VNKIFGGGSSAGRGFCRGRSRVFREVGVSDFAWWWMCVLAWGCGNYRREELRSCRHDGDMLIRYS